MLKIGEKDWIDIGSDENWSYTWDASSEAPGIYTITAKAVDLVGNENIASIKVYIDLSIPTISLTSPSNGAYVSGHIDLVVNVSDDESVRKVYLSTNNGQSYDIVLFDGTQKNVSITNSLDTTVLPDGDNTLVVRAEDNSGRNGNGQVLIKIDNKLPSVLLTSHSLINGYLVFSEDTIVSGTIDDVYPPNSVLVVLNNNTNIANLSGYSWSYPLTFQLTDPVTNNLTVIAVDKVNTTNSTNFTCVIDKVTPSSYITFPVAGSFTNGVVLKIEGYSVDDIGISKVLLSLDGGTNYFQVTNTNANGTNYFWTNVNLNLLSEGNITLIAKAYDYVGKSLNSQGVLFTLDKTPPSITISSPTDNTTVSTQFVISASSVDNNNPVSYMVIRIDGVPVKTNTGNLISYNYVTNVSGEGKKIIEVIAVDRAGNPSSSTISVVVNTDPAKVSNVNISSGGSGIYVRGNVAITGTAYDSFQVSNVGYTIGGPSNFVWVVSNASSTSTNFSFSFDSTSYPDGLNTLYIRPLDNLGGFVDFSTNIYIDNTKPIITFVNPDANYKYYGGLFSVIISVNDNILLQSFRIFTNGSIFSNDTTSLNGKTSEIVSFVWDLTPLNNGNTNSIVFELVDKANNTNYATNYFIVSNDIPGLTVNNPVVNSFISTNLFISGVAIYTNGGIKNVQWKVGTNPFQDAQINSFSPDGTTNYFTNNTATSNVYQEGSRILTVRAIASNNTYIDKSVVFYLDYTLPNGQIISPTNGNSYYGTITISGTASDTNSTSYNSGVSNLKLYIQTNGVSLTGWNGVVLVDNTNASTLNWSTNWDTTTLPVGTNINIIVEITDRAGNKRYLTNTINVRPYITSLSTNNTWVGNTLTVNGSNFGTGSVDIVFKSASQNSPSGLNNSRSITIPASARSGYVKVVVNGIESINSNWIDLWDFVNAGSVPNAQVNSRFTLGPNDKIYFVQSGKSGATWATNFLRTDYSGAFQNIPFFGSSIPNGEVAGNGNAIDVRSNIIVTAYSPVKQGGIWVTILTNGTSSTGRLTNVQIDSITLAGTPLMDVFIDKNLGIHVVYSDKNNGKIKYAYSANRGTNWIIEDVATNVGFSPVEQDAQPSVYVDVYGNQHVAYYDHTYGKLMHAYKSGTVWQVEIADSLQVNGLYSDIVIDTNNTIHISYYNGDQGDLMYSSKNGGWIREIVDYSGICGKFTGIDINGNEKAISYFSETYSVGYLGYYNGTSWRLIQVPQYTGMNVIYGRYSGVRFSSAGDPWVGFVDGANVLWVAKYRK